MAGDETTQISAAPTKAFFIDMLTRDIALEQAILDLVDNCVDGAKRVGGLDGRSIRLSFDADQFRIVDNCGGFGKETARNYAFRFGRPLQAVETPNSIGQFGIGMKRALFKFGRQFRVKSATLDEQWAVDVDVDVWEQNDDWHFKWAEFGRDKPISRVRPGTEIVVTRLRSFVAARFATRAFQNLVMDQIKSKHRQFISKGLSIRVNGRHVNALSLYLLANDRLRPGYTSFKLTDPGERDVDVTILVGLASSSPKEAGWYVICNGRVVLEADRGELTGWGLMEAEAGRVIVPSFHNQFARFRGIITFDSIDSRRVPWTTTKNDVDQDSSVWARAFPRMTEMMRTVVSFLNELDRDIDENSREFSPLYQLVTSSQLVRSDQISQSLSFTAPSRGDVAFSAPTVKIQYSRPVSDVEFLKETFKVGSAKAVGERTFDMTLKRQRG